VVKILLAAIGAVVAVIGLSVVGLVFFSHTASDETGAGPSAGAVLGLDGDTFDLGDVPADQTVERVVAFSNPGGAPLDVAVVKVRPAPDAACGCGVEGYEVRPGAVPAGGVGELVFKLRVPANMPDMEDVMIAELRTNDPANPNPKIRLVFRMAAGKEARTGG
jgi:hypothetical protein